MNEVGPSVDVADSRIRSFRLAYGLWECDHCGSQFVAMTGCQNCGKDGPQTDEEVERRRAITARVRAALDGLPDMEPLDLHEVWGELSDWIEHLYDAFERIGQKAPDGEDALFASLAALARLKAAAAATPRHRPLINLYWRVDGILEALDGLARANLGALDAPTPDEALAYEARGQLLLDAAAEQAHHAGALMDRLGIDVRGTFFEQIARDTEHAFSSANAEGLVDFEARGGQIYERITGGLACPKGLGFSLMLTDSKVQEGFNAERFHREVRHAFDAYIARPTQLDALISDSEWREDVRRAARELFSAAVEAFDQASGSIQHEWFQTRAMLRLSLLMTEGVAPVYLATLLALHRKGDWRRYRGWDPGQMIKEVTDAKYGDFVTGLDTGVRDADAHRAYQQLDDGIELTARARVSGREISAEELLDLTLAAVESCLMLQTALSCAMTARGVPLEELDAASDLVPKLEQIQIVASAAGLGDVVVEQDGATLKLTATGWMEAPQVLSTAAALAAAAPDGVEVLAYEVIAADGTTWTASGPLEPFHRMRGVEGIAKECATVETSARWRVRGDPVFGGAYIRKWSAIRLGQTLSNLDETLDGIDAMSAMANAIGDTRLQKTLLAFGRLTRARRAGLPPPKKDAWASAQLVAWMSDGPHPPAIT